MHEGRINETVVKEKYDRLMNAICHCVMDDGSVTLNDIRQMVFDIRRDEMYLVATVSRYQIMDRVRQERPIDIPAFMFER